MSRRQRHVEEESHDSVLDTMTNVVGILIIVVTVAHLSLSDSIGGLGSKPMPDTEVTPEALEAARTSAEEITRRLEEARSRWSVLEGPAADDEIAMADVQRTLEALRHDADRPVAYDADPNRLGATMAGLEAQRIELVTAVDNSRREMESLSRRVDTDGPVEPTEITLPDPDPSRAEDKEERMFYVRRGELFEFRVAEIAEAWRRAIATADAQGKASSWRDRLSRYVREIERKDYGSQNFKIAAEYVGVRWIYEDDDGQFQVVGDIDLELRLRPNAVGWGLDAIADRRGGYQRALGKLKPSKHWLMFRVYDDSFETYLTARAIAEEHGFAVGWMPYSDDQEIRTGVFRPGGGPGAQPD